MRYETTKSEVIADMAVAICSVVSIMTCWGREGWLFQAGLIWGGMCAGYIVTIYLNQGEDDE